MFIEILISFEFEMRSRSLSQIEKTRNPVTIQYAPFEMIEITVTVRVKCLVVEQYIINIIISSLWTFHRLFSFRCSQQIPVGVGVVPIL